MDLSVFEKVNEIENGGIFGICFHEFCEAVTRISVLTAEKVLQFLIGEELRKQYENAIQLEKSQTKTLAIKLEIIMRHFYGSFATETFKSQNKFSSII